MVNIIQFIMCSSSNMYFPLFEALLMAMREIVAFSLSFKTLLVFVERHSLPTTLDLL